MKWYAFDSSKCEEELGEAKQVFYDAWDNVRKYSDGVSGALFKGFASKYAAYAWLDLPEPKSSSSTQPSSTLNASKSESQEPTGELL